MNQRPIIPVILCGGTGTRLWPLSRESFPKQYLSINTQDNKSLLQSTQERIMGIKNIKKPILICNEEHRFIVAEQMREINIKPGSILLEPIGKNTAPAINLAALVALEKEKDPILLVLSSDHEVKNTSQFKDMINLGIRYCDDNKLVTFGIVPTSPMTGYGYIKSENPFESIDNKGSRINEFIEKPNLEKAKKLIKDKRYTWNSGIFMFKAKTILKEIQESNPKIYKFCLDALLNSEKDLDFRRLQKDAFQKCPDLSIDVAVMEKTKRGIVIPLDAGWSDIGSWESVWQSSDKDINGNFIHGKVIAKDTKNCYLRGDERLIVSLGIDNLIVVETSDAILVSEKKSSQDIKNVVSELKRKKIPAGQIHKKIYRPWGNYSTISEGPNWQVKLIKVKPKEQLSLQMHNHRSEHWIIVKGKATVEIEEKKFCLEENQSTYIPKGSKHRLANIEDLPLLLIEVQSGNYLGEDDIIRYEDKYGRCQHKK